MTGPDRITNVLKAYTLGARSEYKPRGSVGQTGRDVVLISSEGLQKSKELLSGLESGASSKSDVASQSVESSRQTDYNLEILNLSSGASTDQIHNAYLSAIKQYHPDKFGGFSPEFRKLSEEKSKQIILANKKLTKTS